MIIETIELYTGQEISINELQSKLNNGDFNDILSLYSILIMTDVGVVKIDKETRTIISNPLVDLSLYALKSDIPKLSIDENGNLTVTINDITKTYAPISETEIIKDDIE